VSKKVWKVVETKTREIKMMKTKEKRKKGRKN